MKPEEIAAARAVGAFNARGMIFMLLATLALTSMHALVRFLSAEMHAFEITFFRNLFGLLVMAPLMFRAGMEALKSRQPGLQLLRSCFGILAMALWFYGLGIVPIAEATALSFTAAIFGSIAAALFLRERMRLRRWTAVFTGFVGALIILRPGFHSVQPGAWVVLASSVFWALALVTVKRLSRTDSVVCIVSWNSVLLTLFSLPLALPVWITPTSTQMGWLLLVGLLATLGHLAMTNAFRLADATAVFPVDFTRLLWASLLGFLLFAEWPDAATWMGGAVIFASTTYITFRERRAGKD
ncbi:MAG TPA: DMT family transporter [Gammaproteobacteria bacterium]|nr:DMT family transporter [Gammaproteobacteria bacterium]